MDRPSPLNSYLGMVPPSVLMDTVKMTPFTAANNGSWTGDWTVSPVPPPLFSPYPPEGYPGNMNYQGVGRKSSFFECNNSQSQHSLGSQGSSSFESNSWSTRTPESLQLFDSPKKNYPPPPRKFAAKRQNQNSFGFFELSKYGNPIEPPCTRRPLIANMPWREVNHNQIKDHGFFNGDTYWHSTYGQYRASGPPQFSERSSRAVHKRSYGGRAYVTQSSVNRDNWVCPPVFNGPVASNNEDASKMADKPHQTKQCVSDDDDVIDAVNSLLEQVMNTVDL